MHSDLNPVQIFWQSCYRLFCLQKIRAGQPQSRAHDLHLIRVEGGRQVSQNQLPRGCVPLAKPIQGKSSIWVPSFKSDLSVHRVGVRGVRLDELQNLQSIRNQLAATSRYFRVFVSRPCAVSGSRSVSLWIRFLPRPNLLRRLTSICNQFDRSPAGAPKGEHCFESNASEREQGRQICQLTSSSFRSCSGIVTRN